LFSLPDDLEKLVVSGLKPLAEFALSFLPVFGKGRFPDALTFPISVGNPKNLSVVAFEYSTIMFTSGSLQDTVWKTEASIDPSRDWLE